jgi:hypothetical protein
MEATEIYPFFQQLKKKAVEKFEDIASAECHWCPSWCDMVDLPEKFPELSKEKRTEAKNWAANNIFKYRWFYNQGLQLLGVYSVPDALCDMFDLTVNFQNSCDQNYSREDWEGIKLFENIYDWWMNKTDEQIITKYNGGHVGNDFEEHYKSRREEYLEYYRRTYCYEEIWNMFEHTLYNDEDVVYLTLFNNNAMGDMKEISQFVVECFKKYKEFEKEWEK